MLTLTNLGGPGCKYATVFTDGYAMGGPCQKDQLSALQFGAEDKELCWYRYEPGDGTAQTYYDPSCAQYSATIDAKIAEVFKGTRPWYKSWKVWTAVGLLAAAGTAGAFVWHARG